MTFDLTTIINSINSVFFIKTIFLIFTAMFIVFMSVLLTQINSMEDIITQEHSSYSLKIITACLIAAGIGIFIYTAFVL